MGEGESPDNGSKLQSKLGVLDYSQENIQLRSRTPVIEFNVEGHEKMKQKFDIVIDEKTSDNKNVKKNQTESNNQPEAAWPAIATPGREAATTRPLRWAGSAGLRTERSMPATISTKKVVANSDTSGCTAA